MRIIHGKELLQRYGMDYFKGASTLGALSEKAINYLLNEGRVIQLDPGDRLFSFGDPGDSFYIILKGSIGFYKPREGGLTHIRDYTYGQEVGCVAMIGLHDRVGDAQASEDSYILEVSSALFSDLHMTLPNDFGVLLLNLSREMARRLRESDNKLAVHDINE